MKLLRTLSLGKGLNRRQLLKALGMGAASVPLMPRLEGWAAPGDKPPKRLLLLFTSSGIVPEMSYPTGSETAWNFPANGSWEPMTRHKNDLIIMRNLPRGWGGGGGHEASMGGLWTGNVCASSVAQAPSVDQVIAKAMPKMTDFHTYQFGVMCFYAGEGDITSKIKNNNPYMIHTGPGQKVASQCDPYAVFDKVLAGLGTGTTPDPNMERLRAQKLSVLDALKGDFADVEAKVGREDKVKIQSHLTSLRDIERRLSSGGATMVGAIPRPDGGIALDRSANYEKLIPIMNKIVVTALAADKTRIASLQWSRGFSQIRHTWVGAKDAHHTISHIESQKTLLANIQRWYGTRFAELFDEFKKVPEAGGTLLDNTLCVYSNELALGWTHGCSPAATWWATGANSKFQGLLKGSGRYIDYAGTGFDYNQMLQTMYQLMVGMPPPKIGGYGKAGVIPNLLA